MRILLSDLVVSIPCAPVTFVRYEFKSGTFFDSFFDDGGKNLGGTLTIIENKNGNLTSLLYKLSGTMTLVVATKENIQARREINTYEGLLGIDKEDSIYDPKIKYDSKISYNENTQTFSLVGQRD